MTAFWQEQCNCIGGITSEELRTFEGVVGEEPSTLIPISLRGSREGEQGAEK